MWHCRVTILGTYSWQRDGMALVYDETAMEQHACLSEQREIAATDPTLDARRSYLGPFQSADKAIAAAEGALAGEGITSKKFSEPDIIELGDHVIAIHRVHPEWEA